MTAAVIAIKPSQAPQPSVANLDKQMRRSRRYLFMGFLTIVAFFVGFVGWASQTQLAGAVLAAGNVVVASNVKKVQHPTGGVVGQIFVKNGDHVKAGDLLLRLDETITRANLGIISKQMDELAGQQARLIAERDDKDSISFPPDLLKRSSDDADVDQTIGGERSLFEKRVSSRTLQRQQLDQRIAATREEIAGTEGQVVAKSKEISLIGKQLESLEDLETRQLVTSSKMMELRRDAARLEGERAQLLAAIGQAKGRIAEIEVKKTSVGAEAKSEVAKELREAQGKLAELGERRIAAEDQLRRIEMRSPVDGIVHQLSVFTVGGVVSTSEPVMLIVPESDKLVIEAKVSPNDIDQLHLGHEATVRFPAFSRRTTPTIVGHVSTISADLTKEVQNNTAYFVVRIEIPDKEIAKLEGAKLTPGMPAEIQITTENRSALSYLLKPIEDQYARAFKER